MASPHKGIMGNPSAGKDLMMRELATYFGTHGWTADSSEYDIRYSPPDGATREEIASTQRGADALLASWGLPPFS